MLLPSGFTFAWVNVRTISIVSPPANVPPGGVKEAVAAKDQQRSELSKEQQLSMANGGGKSGSARGPYEFDGKMLVEGQRIFDSVFDSLDLDIPVTVFDREDIEALGASTRHRSLSVRHAAAEHDSRGPSWATEPSSPICAVWDSTPRSCSSTGDGRSRLQVRLTVQCVRSEQHSAGSCGAHRDRVRFDVRDLWCGRDRRRREHRASREHSRADDSTSTMALQTVARSSGMPPSVPQAAAVAREVRSCSTTSIAARCSAANAIAGTIRTSRASAASIGVSDCFARQRQFDHVCKPARPVIEFRGDTGHEPGRYADAGGLRSDRRATESRKSLSLPTSISYCRHAQELQSRKVNTGSTRQLDRVRRTSVRRSRVLGAI